MRLKLLIFAILVAGGFFAANLNFTQSVVEGDLHYWPESPTRCLAFDEDGAGGSTQLFVDHNCDNIFNTTGGTDFYLQFVVAVDTTDCTYDTSGSNPEVSMVTYNSATGKLECAEFLDESGAQIGGLAFVNRDGTPSYGVFKFSDQLQWSGSAVEVEDTNESDYVRLGNCDGTDCEIEHSGGATPNDGFLIESKTGHVTIKSCVDDPGLGCDTAGGAIILTPQTNVIVRGKFDVGESGTPQDASILGDMEVFGNFTCGGGTGCAQTTAPTATNTALTVNSTDAGHTGDLMELQSSGTTQVAATNSGTLLLVENSAAEADIAGYGQIWVKNDTPNTLYFTNDAGTDGQIIAGVATDAQVSDTLTIDGTGTVDWQALNNYPGACGAGTVITSLGDIIVCGVDQSAKSLCVGTSTYLDGEGGCDTLNPGDVFGPASSQDNGVTRFNGTGGKTLQDSDWNITDAGVMRSAMENGWLEARVTGSGLTTAFDIGSGANAAYPGGFICGNERYFECDVTGSKSVLSKEFTASSGGTFSGTVLSNGVFRLGQGSLADEATPSVSGFTSAITSGTANDPITDFDDGVLGQLFILRAAHAITVEDNANIDLQGILDYSMGVGDTLMLIMGDSDVWYELSRSDN